MLDNQTPPQPVYSAPYKSGDAIYVAGMALTITGKPQNGDTFTVKPTRGHVHLRNAGSSDCHGQEQRQLRWFYQLGALAHGLAKSLAQVDTQLNRVSTVRGVAGDLLNQAERMGTTLAARSEQMETQRSAAGRSGHGGGTRLSELKTQETAVSAALQSYASITVQLHQLSWRPGLTLQKLHRGICSECFGDGLSPAVEWRAQSGWRAAFPACAPDTQVDTAHLLRILREMWAPSSPQLLLSPQSAPLLQSLLSHHRQPGLGAGGARRVGG